MDLYYEVKGSGKPLILIHSGGSDIRDWTYIATVLSKHFLVITYDGRGAGKSPSLLKPANYVEDLRLILEHLQIENAVIIGHSMGGQIATDFSLTYPDKVSELILIAPGLTGFNYSKELLDSMKKVSEAAPNVEKMVQLALAVPTNRIVMNSPHRELMIDMMRQHILKTFEWKTFEIIWSDPPSIERLGAIKANTLFIIGTEDIPDNYAVAESFKRVPNIEFIEIEGADHMVTLTHPEQVSQSIIKFLKS
ncbi:alpha/beta fold hydrolase [Metabacillus niabensis]|uniref:Pimeloyl-ACP methyl ester carboxylesterase n=1 Tax=Metabacillus niabensis TaxID=324854 RepID=A0ABT9Z6R5_9BACI|nr:alpha/beta hydrolase [Metabacillus niabensis]MDQ0227897.1 pimeloyl-ACP methyl ester carboxylesterase [Metabacillus niabensis]